ncbi:TAXI family TRAP transporter solute-binding subunit [Halosolutus gelatinilyticus]|uniref:TAXI family TRAP transporter solute-binding subunit n=1 Tax=Halosolutus gelatinilyticus TaxID=2931975 RepID=UPI001FF6859E|nr:TAXI family TRAP transporter solute-binding subunit [Halosolutus gelatinilyticus]
MANPSGDSHGCRSRRSILAATGVGTASALAGCLGGDSNGEGSDDGSGDGGSGETTVRMRTSTASTTAYAANQGLASAVNDGTDELFVEAQTSQGTEANLGALNGGDAEMVYIQNWSAYEVREGVEPFDQLDFEMTQVFHFYDLPWFFITDDADLETLSDIGDGTTVSPTPSGSGTAPALERALGYATDGYERVSTGYGEQGNAMNENQLDVGVGTLMNFAITPSWLQEIASSVDLRVLDVDDSTAQAWEDDERLLSQPTDVGQIENATTPGEVPAPTFSYNFICRGDLEYDTVYTFLEAMYEQRSSLSEYHGILGTFEDDAFWVQNVYENVPFHPAAADFYEEIGVWSDDFDRADE